MSKNEGKAISNALQGLTKFRFINNHEGPWSSGHNVMVIQTVVVELFQIVDVSEYVYFFNFLFKLFITERRKKNTSNLFIKMLCAGFGYFTAIKHLNVRITFCLIPEIFFFFKQCHSADRTGIIKLYNITHTWSYSILSFTHNRFTTIKPINTQSLWCIICQGKRATKIHLRHTGNMFCISACDKQLSVCSDYICLSTNSYCFVLQQRLNVFDRTFEASCINSYFHSAAWIVDSWHIVFKELILYKCIL